MKFDVTYKGIRQFTGRLAEALDFVQRTWGGRDRAWELGVKLTPSPNYNIGH